MCALEDVCWCISAVHWCIFCSLHSFEKAKNCSLQIILLHKCFVPQFVDARCNKLHLHSTAIYCIPKCFIAYSNGTFNFKAVHSFQCITVHSSAVQYSAFLKNAVQCIPLQCSAVHSSTMQYSAFFQCSITMALPLSVGSVPVLPGSHFVCSVHE